MEILHCLKMYVSYKIRITISHMRLCKMWDDGYRNITNVDVRLHLSSLFFLFFITMISIFSILQSSLNRCRNDMAKFDQRWSVRCHFFIKHHSILNSLSGHEMDVRNLSFQADSFDVAIDKGTMDAMMTAKGDVWVCTK